MSVLESKQMRKAAEGCDCMLAIAGVCTYETDTVVMCHFPSEIAGYKSTDFSSAPGCVACHAVIDRRVTHVIPEVDREFYMRRAQTRWLNHLWEVGIISVKGVKQ